MKVAFFERGKVLQVRVAYNGKYLRLSTGINNPTHLKFHTTKQCYSGTSEEVKGLNSEINRHRSFIQEVANNGYDLRREYEAFTKDVAPDLETDSYSVMALLQRYLNETSTGKIKSRGGARIKYSTINCYRFVVNTIGGYAYKAPELDILKFNLSNIQDVSKKRQIADRWAEWMDGLMEYMRKNAYKINTKSMVMNVLGIIIKHYEKEFFLMLPPVPKIKSHENPIVIFPPEFIKTFLTDKTYESLETPQMKFMWEVSATILITSMRISDALSLKWAHLTERPDGLFLNKANQKTGAITSMLLPKRLGNIYKENMAQHGHIFTPVNTDPQNLFYKNITDLFAMYKELQHVVTASKINHRGEPEFVSRPLYEWVTPHMLRKTAITSMLTNGVSEEHVKFASGHSPRSQAFDRYRGFIDRNFHNQISEYYGALT